MLSGINIGTERLLYVPFGTRGGSDVTEIEGWKMSDNSVRLWVQWLRLANVC